MLEFGISCKPCLSSITVCFDKDKILENARYVVSLQIKIAAQKDEDGGYIEKIYSWFYHLLLCSG